MGALATTWETVMRASNPVMFNFKGRTPGAMELKFTSRAVRFAERELDCVIIDAVMTERPRLSELVSVLAWAGLVGGGMRNLTIDQADTMVDAYLEAAISNAGDDPDARTEARGDAQIEILKACGIALVEAGILKFNVFDEEEMRKWHAAQEAEAEARQAADDGAEILPEDPPKTTA